MKKIFIIVALIVFLFAKPLYALKFGFSLDPHWSMYYGDVHEYVWAATTDGHYNYKLSELVWDVKPLWTGGFKATFLLDNFMLSGDFSFGLPLKSGSMRDSDWLNGDFPSLSYKTHYSIHDSQIIEFMNANAQFGYNFAFDFGLTVTPFLSFVHRVFKFNAKNGFADYPAGWFSEDPPPYTEAGSGINREYLRFLGNVITYEQYMQYFALGTSVAYKPLKHLDFGVSFAFSPFVFAADYDRHVLRQTDFLDIMYGGFAFSGDLKTRIIANKTLSFSASAGIEYVFNLKGPYFIKATGENNSTFDALYNARTFPIYALALTNNALNAGSIQKSKDAQGGAGQFLLIFTLSIQFLF